MRIAVFSNPRSGSTYVGSMFYQGLLEKYKPKKAKNWNEPFNTEIQKRGDEKHREKFVEILEKMKTSDNWCAKHHAYHLRVLDRFGLLDNLLTTNVDRLYLNIRQDIRETIASHIIAMNTKQWVFDIHHVNLKITDDEIKMHSRNVFDNINYLLDLQNKIRYDGVIYYEDLEWNYTKDLQKLAEFQGLVVKRKWAKTRKFRPKYRVIVNYEETYKKINEELASFNKTRNILEWNDGKFMVKRIDIK